MLDLPGKVASMSFLQLDSTHGILKIKVLAPCFLIRMRNNKELTGIPQVFLYHIGKLKIGLLVP